MGLNKTRISWELVLVAGSGCIMSVLVFAWLEVGRGAGVGGVWKG